MEHKATTIVLTTMLELCVLLLLLLSLPLLLMALPYLTLSLGSIQCSDHQVGLLCTAVCGSEKMLEISR